LEEAGGGWNLSATEGFANFSQAVTGDGDAAFNEGGRVDNFELISPTSFYLPRPPFFIFNLITDSSHGPTIKVKLCSHFFLIRKLKGNMLN
jgi:hypothetical protein